MAAPARGQGLSTYQTEGTVGAAPGCSFVAILHAELEWEAFTTTRTSRSRVSFVAVLCLTLSACGYNTILVATVQGYAKQEIEVLTAVIEARARATQVKVDASKLTDPDKLKQFQDAQAQLTGALGRLLAVSENYPDLKSNQNFLALQSQLEGTENRIAVARRDYI